MRSMLFVVTAFIGLQGSAAAVDAFTPKALELGAPLFTALPITFEAAPRTEISSPAKLHLGPQRIDLGRLTRWDGNPGGQPRSWILDAPGPGYRQQQAPR